MKNSLSTYVTVYKNVSDITSNAANYRNVSVFFPLTVSFNVSGHEKPLDIALDVLRLWDVLSGADLLVNKTIPNNVFLYAIRILSNSQLVRSCGLRIVGLSEYPEVDIKEWAQLETIISHLITFDTNKARRAITPVTMAEHFGSVARHSTTTHLWIFGQGDFAIPSTLEAVAEIFGQDDVPDIISFPVGHSMSAYLEQDTCFGVVQANQLESISGSLYRRNFLCNIPKKGDGWWPHIESVLEELQREDKIPSHILMGKGQASGPNFYVSVAPNPNWMRTPEAIDDVFIERYRVCLSSLERKTGHFVWTCTLGELDFAEGLTARGRMTNAELRYLWESVCGGSNELIHLKPGPTVLIPFSEDKSSQTLMASVFFKLKKSGHAVYALPSGNLDVSISGLISMGRLNDVDSERIELKPQDISGATYTFKLNSWQLKYWGDVALESSAIKN